MTPPYRAAERHLLASPASFPVPAGCVAPRYAGRSIANLGPSLAQLFGVPFVSPLPPWEPDVLGDLGEGVQRVLFFLFDAVGWLHLTTALEQGHLPTLERWLGEGARLTPLTSTFPSTTTAATTSIWNGHAPSQHGLLGLTLFLRELGMMANVLFERPLPAGRPHSGLLTEWGAALPDLVGVPSSARQLAPHRIETRTFLLRSLVGSSLSTIHYDGGQVSGVVSVIDLAVSAAGALAKRAAMGRRAIVGGYWDTVDALSHIYGPTTPRWALEVEMLFRAVAQGVALLPAPARDGTLLLVMADHGQTSVTANEAVKLTDHPALMALLDNQLGGDPRATYVHTRRPDAVRGYVKQRLAHALDVLDIAEALEGGLWGPPPFHPQARSRLGDLLLLARGPHTFLWGPEPSGNLGLHGGLSPEEMLVPLVALRLD